MDGGDGAWVGGFEWLIMSVLVILICLAASIKPVMSTSEQMTQIPRGRSGVLRENNQWPAQLAPRQPLSCRCFSAFNGGVDC